MELTSIGRIHSACSQPAAAVTVLPCSEHENSFHVIILGVNVVGPTEPLFIGI